MREKKIKYILAVIVSSTILGLGSYYLFKYFRRYMVMRAQKEAAQIVEREMVGMQALGFAPDSELIESLESYKKKLAAYDAGFPDSVHLETLLSLNRKMLSSYVCEIRQLRKQGLAADSNLMKFAYDKVVRLTIAVAELERQLKAELADRTEFEKRVDRMREITQQSVAHYKNQLRDYLAQGVSEDDERLQHVRKILTIRVKHLCMM